MSRHFDPHAPTALRVPTSTGALTWRPRHGDVNALTASGPGVTWRISADDDRAVVFLTAVIRREGRGPLHYVHADTGDLAVEEKDAAILRLSLAAESMTNVRDLRDIRLNIEAELAETRPDAVFA